MQHSQILCQYCIIGQAFPTDSKKMQLTCLPSCVPQIPQTPNAQPEAHSGLEEHQYHESGRRHSDPGHSGGDLRHEEKTWPYFRHQISWNLATKEGFMMIYVYIDYIWIIYGFDI